MLLVTGATGFVGQALAHVLAALPAPQRPALALLVRSQQAPACQLWRTLHPTACWLEGTLEAPASWQPAARALPLTHIAHLAALVAHSHAQQAAMHQINVHGSLAVAELARACGARLVFLSSSGTVACSTDPAARPTESAPFATATAGRWPYYASKMAAERALRAALPHAAQLSILRPPMMLGPGDERFRSTRTVVRFLRGRVPFVLRGGLAVIDVREVARSVWAALATATPAPIYHLPGHALSLRAYFAELARLTGRRAPRLTLPPALAFALAHGGAAVHARWPRLLREVPLDPITLAMGQHYWGLGTALGDPAVQPPPRPLEQTLRDTVVDVCARRTDCGSATA